MVTIILKYSVDLNSGVLVTPIKPEFFVGDEEAHQFIIHCYRDAPKNQIDLSGASVDGYFVRADGATIPIEGQVENNAAVVQLPPACYARQGRFKFTVKIVRGDVIETIFQGVGNVNMTTTDEVVDPGQVVPSIDKLLAEVGKLEDTAKRAETVANMTAKAKTLPAGYDATAEYNKETGELTIGIPLSRMEGGGSGGGMPTINETLVIDAEGDLGVNTTDQVEENNRLPITSAAVYTTVGNINALLETI